IVPAPTQRSERPGREEARFGIAKIANLRVALGRVQDELDDRPVLCAERIELGERDGSVGVGAGSITIVDCGGVGSRAVTTSVIATGRQTGSIKKCDPG